MYMLKEDAQMPQLEDAQMSKLGYFNGLIILDIRRSKGRLKEYMGVVLQVREVFITWMNFYFA